MSCICVHFSVSVRSALSNTIFFLHYLIKLFTTEKHILLFYSFLFCFASECINVHCTTFWCTQLLCTFNFTYLLYYCVLYCFTVTVLHCTVYLGTVFFTVLLRFTMNSLGLPKDILWVSYSSFNMKKPLYRLFFFYKLRKKESRITETKHLSTDANCSTYTKKILIVRQNSPKKHFFPLAILHPL